ncbi:hypothetical protein [Bacillus sp. V59.32b]|uniref:hypothetical protein n=1 Tax=Bacillus sp. V59.32b TaxID=1758642 RepID=UPI0020B153C0|nr:hypothetical protein [Bacillus sp. V59.32b]
MTWQKKEWQKPSILQIRFISSNETKTTISFHHEKLADVYVPEEMKCHWEEVLEKIKGTLTCTGPA